MFVWFHGSKEIERFKQIFGLHSKCLVKDLPPLSMLYVNEKIFAERNGSLHSFIYSLSSQQDCVLPVVLWNLSNALKESFTYSSIKHVISISVTRVNLNNQMGSGNNKTLSRVN